MDFKNQEEFDEFNSAIKALKEQLDKKNKSHEANALLEMLSIDINNFFRPDGKNELYKKQYCDLIKDLKIKYIDISEGEINSLLESYFRLIAMKIFFDNDLDIIIRQVLSKIYQIDASFKQKFNLIQSKVIYDVIEQQRLSCDMEKINALESNLKKADDKNTELKEKLDKIDALDARIKELTTNFNFVALNKGFSELEERKKKDIDTSKKYTTLLGFFAALPFLLEILTLVFYPEVFTPLKEMIWLLGSAVLGLELLLIYFFRVALAQQRSFKAQLLQIELRKSLCEFIQSYTDYAQKIKEKDKSALEKFENLIFSGIVSNEDQLPSAYDGLEQISRLVQAVKGQNGK